jgi:hypothetical protein
MVAEQTLSSVGYGNMLPYTAAEWWVACVLVLMSGLMWAFLLAAPCGRRRAHIQDAGAGRRQLASATPCTRRCRLRCAPAPACASAAKAFHGVPYLRALEHDAQLSCAASCRVMAFAAGVRLDILGADPLTRGVSSVATGAALLRRRSGHKEGAPCRGPRRPMHAYVKGMSLGTLGALAASLVRSHDVVLTLLTLSDSSSSWRRSAVLAALARRPDAWRALRAARRGAPGARRADQADSSNQRCTVG